jgi:hypothetical protein
MNRTRVEHLAWCKSRAVEILDSGDVAGAIASMSSDITKWSEPLYDAMTLRLLQADGALFCSTPAQARHWIEGFS